MKNNSTYSDFERISFRMHPRVFAALGADLVTSDIVAIIELVKNSYDAFARNVWIRFLEDDEEGPYLEIEDDGDGMTKDVIENAWCVVATPYKEKHQYAFHKEKKRRVAGEKGLGRLSAARLGASLSLLTQAPNSPCYELKVDWSELAEGDDISQSYVHCRKYSGKVLFEKKGTMLRVFGLKAEWDEDRIIELEDNLGRLVSPFHKLKDFRIRIFPPGAKEDEEIEIESPKFLDKPKYSIKGNVLKEGLIKANYEYHPIKDGEMRQTDIIITWDQVLDGLKKQDKQRFSRLAPTGPKCGPFNFEIRAWDVGSDDTQEISDAFNYQKSKIRKAIKSHKGISVYRDDILVLPKSDGARDWLGLDLRRVSKLGTRVSTSQLIGYVSISADRNPKIEDTSDRERLVHNRESIEFEELLKAIVGSLENEREKDRRADEDEKPLEDLFGEISAEDVMEDIVSLAKDGADASDAVPIIRAYSNKVARLKKTIQERFGFYSRMATVGTIAHLLVHEIRNRTTAIGILLDTIKDRFSPFEDELLEKHFKYANESTHALERLADRFSPLASRAFRRKKRDSILEVRLRECMELHGGELRRRKIEVKLPSSETRVAVDPGELDAILLNLITNASYWLTQVPEEQRFIEVKLSKLDDGKRVRVHFHDSGPGISEEDVDKVFWPGITRKPGGIGMGLTVASELIDDYGGKMSTKYPGHHGGATFMFDLPVKS